MHLRALLAPALLLVALAACSDKAPEFNDPLTALESAGAAKQAMDYDLALAGYEYAAANAGSDKDLLCQALLGMGEIQAENGDFDAAGASFGRIQSECADQLNPRRNERLVVAFMKAGAIEQARTALAAMATRHPNETELLARLDAAITAAEAGDQAALSELGYAGD